MRRFFPLVLAFLWSCAPPPKIQQQTSIPRDLLQLEKEVHDLVNRHRESRGLRPLNVHPTLVREARRHSSWMAEQGGPASHDGFAQRSGEIKKSLRYRRIAENVASNSGFEEPATVAFNGWLESEGHRLNIEGDFRLTGIGVARDRYNTYYFTQLFLLD